MNISDVRTTGYSVTGDRTRKIVQNAAENSFAELVSRKQQNMFSNAFPQNKLKLKTGNCTVGSKTWEREDFPAWEYFYDDVNADSLNNWKPTARNQNIQQELSRIGFGEMVVIIPESLQRKMQVDTEYAKEIIAKVQKWKEDYDHMDNAIAASYGDDPVLYQMTKSYCIQLDENGDVGNYMVVSGGMDTSRQEKATEVEKKEEPQKIAKKSVRYANIIQADFRILNCFEYVDYTKIIPYFMGYYRQRRF